MSTANLLTFTFTDQTRGVITFTLEASAWPAAGQQIAIVGLASGYPLTGRYTILTATPAGATTSITVTPKDRAGTPISREVALTDVTATLLPTEGAGAVRFGEADPDPTDVATGFLYLNTTNKTLWAADGMKWNQLV